MPNLTVWLGLLAAAGIVSWSLMQPGAGLNILDAHGLVLVIGGAAAALLVSTPAQQIFGAVRAFFWILAPRGLPSPEEAAMEIGRLSRKARAEGGLLALRG